MMELTYRVGDFVTRGGDDLHEVLYLSEDGHSGDFKCVEEPENGWTKLGEVESNLARRYTFVRSSS